MNRPATKQELLTLISEGLADAETAISHHPPDTALIYETGKGRFVDGHAKVEETDWSRASGLSLAELSLMHRYLFAMAFISAWHSVRRDKRRRNQTTSPACLLVSGLGFSPEDVLHRFMGYESAWRTVMKPPRRWFRCGRA
jgi:hypothetical protein